MLKNFFLGTHMTNWLGQSKVPLFISARRLRRYKKHHRAIAGWALDSGGFSELLMYGRWVTTPEQYVRETRAWSAQIGSMKWAACQDWMCEPQMLKKTGLTVADHQRLTIDNYLLLGRLAPEVPWVPVLQGFAHREYLQHVADYERAGVRLAELPLVGIGSVCRRQATDAVERVICELSEGHGLRLHGFGFKVKGLLRANDLLESSDSMAWSKHATKRPPLPGCTHKTCANCFKYAMRWRDRLAKLLNMKPPKDGMF